MIRYNKRIAILVTAIVALTVWFASTSRFPAINQKASSAGVLSGGGAISFDPLFEFEETDPYWKKVLYSTANWTNTNKKGMAFGVAIATLFLTVLALVSQRVFKNRWLNTLYGAISGTPLGLCVNCSAPIATGIYQATSRAEAALALMVSSPTLNVIVITMCFALFPMHMAVLKIVLSIGVIAMIPLFVKPERLLPVLKRPGESAEPGIAPSAPSAPSGPAIGATAPGIPAPAALTEPWPRAIVETLKGLGRSFRYIVIRTVPMMLVAGFVASLAVHAIDVGQYMTGSLSLPVLLLASLVGTFIPAPMAFDIISAQVMLAAGVSKAYVMTFLFTLGAYSIYSFFIVWRTISRQIAVLIYVAVFGVGIVAGLAAEAIDRRDVQRTDRFVEQMFPVAAGPGPTSAGPADLAGSTDPTYPTTIPPATPADSGWTHVADLGSGITLLSRPHETPIPMPGAPTAPAPRTFHKIEGPKAGLTDTDRFRTRHFLPPYRTGRGVASGDYDNDGWTDLLLATDRGFALYRNQGARRKTDPSLPYFALQRGALPAGLQTNVFFVAFVDINNDGWLDVFATSYREDNIYYLNRNGRFSAAPADIIRIPGRPQSLGKGATWADIDADGDLDFYIGNWYHPGPTHGTPWRANRNFLYINEGGGRFDERELEEFPGVTQSVLFSDIDADGDMDLVVANDFKTQDFYFLNDGAGNLTPMPGGPGGIPVTPRLSMSIDTADINNDLLPDLLLTNTGGSFESSPLPRKRFETYCTHVEDAAARAECEYNVRVSAIMVRELMSSDSFDQCRAVAGESGAGPAGAAAVGPTGMDASDLDECLAMVLSLTATTRNQPELCERIPPEQAFVRADCLGFFDKVEDRPPYGRRPVRQVLQKNVLLLQASPGRFLNVADEYGVENTEWTWTGKFADLDHDGWQDIYVVNGRWGHGRVLRPNVLLWNREGERFDIARSSAAGGAGAAGGSAGSGSTGGSSSPGTGLDDYPVVSGFTWIDLDNDGDLDIVTNAVNAPPRVYVNQTTEARLAGADPSQAGHSITFEVRDHSGSGNHFGIGMRIVIRTAEEQSQFREIKAGGGFVSFDGPGGHIGLSGTDAIDPTEITWPDSDRSTTSARLSPGTLYRFYKLR